MNKVYLVEKNEFKQEMTYEELNNLLVGKVSPNFMSMLKNLGLKEDMFHHETLLKITRIK